MRGKGKTLLRTILCFLFSIILFWQGAVDVYAINTKFDVPSIEQDLTPDNCLYKSPNLNIMVCKWGYGLVADVLNTSGIDTLLAELHANVSPAGNSRAILGIYMEGAGLSETNASEIAAAGWTEVDLYYETFLVAGSAPTGAMTPSVTMTLDENALAILAEAGITENIAMVSVSDVNMTWANFILYEKEFSFLKGKALYSYKFIADLGIFVPIEETYFGTYGANFLELFDLQKAEADVNGIYVTLTQSLPENLVVSADQVQVLRENLPIVPPTENLPSAPLTEDDDFEPPVSEPEQDETEKIAEQQETETAPEQEEPRQEESGQNALTVTNTDDTVEWKFANGQGPENFTAEATINAVSKTEVFVDFAYSGLLPEDTEVTVQIPSENVNYNEGDTLYLYYCNPETNQRDFVSEGKYQENQVTFKINHCSEYVITSVGPNEIGETDSGMSAWLIAAVFGVIACIIVRFVWIKKKK